MHVQITIERESTSLAADSDEEQVWASIGTIRASLKPLRFSDAERQGAVRTVKGYLFECYAGEIRALAVTEVDRIVWGDETLNIREVRMPDERTTFVEIVAEAGVIQ